ncbi:MAG: CHAT domain-containing protein [Vicinamibacteraceae bacterium]|nr:CHAT domain-containing protein [Vicinamibacteraceae bacterium]MCL4846219.1 CHAT domain-containing protein [Acidobacteriota bacterium]
MTTIDSEDGRQLFRQAVGSTLPGRGLVDACHALWSWLDLPPAERVRRVTEAVGDETAARHVHDARPFVALRLQREAWPEGHAPVEPLADLEARCRDGTATEIEQCFVSRHAALTQIVEHIAVAFPGAVSPRAADPRQADLLAQLPPLTQAMRDCDVGLADTTRLRALETAIETFARRADTWDRPVPADHAWWLGMAQDVRARGAVEIGDLDLARRALADGIACFERAGHVADADRLRERVAALERGVKADFDAAAASLVRALLVAHDPMARAASLGGLAVESHRAGDRFEFARLARELASVLEEAGYVDPEPAFDRATGAWIVVASASVPGPELLGRLADVAGHWAVVCGARISERLGDDVRTDREGVARAEACLAALGPFVAQLVDEADALQREVSAELAWWLGEPGAGDPIDSGTGSSSSPGTAGFLERGAVLDAALYALRLACNVAPAEAQLDEARRLVSEAEHLASRLHLARAWLELAYVRLALGRFAEVAAATAAARAALSPIHPLTLECLASSAEREAYLDATRYDVRAHAAQRDSEAVIALCEPAIAELEAQRRRVSAPYQQAAFLATRAELYEHAVVANLKLGRDDALVDTTERLKAHFAGRRLERRRDRRRDGGADPWADAVERDFVSANRALAAVPAHSTAADALIERRRLLATARALVSAPGESADERPCTVAGVQAALADDEAALSWFWLGDDALVVLAVARGRFEKHTIILTPDDRRQLDRWLTCVQAFNAPRPALEAIVPAIDRIVDALAPRLVPEPVRAFIAGRTRLVLSPHRALHLFPFHAMPWTGGDAPEGAWLGTRFAVRYAPNLSSLLLPWSGCRDGQVVAVGIDRFAQAGWAPLEHSQAEAVDVAAVHGERGQFVANVTRAGFLDLSFTACRCLHLATHGRSVLAGESADDPLACDIALADGVLDGWQVSAIDLRAELVVLAACHSGQRAVGGRGLAQLPGDDLLGLQAAFFEAGAGSVLGALWPVDDASARLILVDLHRAFAAGAEPDVALQWALRAHLANPGRRHTRYDWAPFFVSAIRNTRRQATGEVGS